MAKSTGMVAPRATAEDRKWQAERDLSTLRDAEAIKGDSGRLTAAQKMAQQQMKALQKVAGNAGMSRGSAGKPVVRGGRRGK